MNPSLNLPQLLDDAYVIAKAAGEAILAIYESDFAVTEKADHSPLTEADLAAHRVIVAGLARLDPVLPCLSEEGVDIPFAQRSAWERYWLVDPLDGTREFVNRTDEFTVNIALIENGIPILGVVHAPKLDVAYLAARGHGAQRLRGGDRTPIHARRTPARPSLVVSRFHRTAELEAMLTRLPPHEAVTRGSSLKFCLVAEGSADCYPRTGPTSEWDTAAGQCVVEQAGGQVLRIPDWAPLVCNRKPSLINPGFVVIGDPAWGWPQRLAGAQAMDSPTPMASPTPTGLPTSYRKRIEATLRALGADPALVARRRLPVHAEARRLQPIGMGADGRDKFLTPGAALAWSAMRDAAQKDGVELLLYSAFRGFDYQLALIRGKIARGRSLDEVLAVNAPPGCSEHHSGRALDLGCAGVAPLEETFESTQAFAWLTRRGAEFGFRMSFPRGNRWGFMYEPWHWYFTGVRPGRTG